MCCEIPADAVADPDADPGADAVVHADDAVRDGDGDAGRERVSNAHTNPIFDFNSITYGNASLDVSDCNLNSTADCKCDARGYAAA